MPNLKGRSKGGGKPPASEDLFGVDSLSQEEKLEDWGKRLERYKLAITTRKGEQTKD